jgi:hypothetical protein
MFGSPGNIGHPEGDQYVGELQTFFALIAPNHELPSVWLLTNTIKLSSIPPLIFDAPLLLGISWGGILSPLCSGKCVNYFTYINRELPTPEHQFRRQPNLPTQHHHIVYPVLLFTEDLNAPANCSRY